MDKVKLVTEDNTTIIFKGPRAYDLLYKARDFFDEQKIYYKTFKKQGLLWKRLYTIIDLSKR